MLSRQTDELSSFDWSKPSLQPFRILFKPSEAPSTGMIHHPPKKSELVRFVRNGKKEKKVIGSEQIRMARKREEMASLKIPAFQTRKCGSRKFKTVFS